MDHGIGRCRVALARLGLRGSCVGIVHQAGRPVAHLVPTLADNAPVPGGVRLGGSNSNRVRFAREIVGDRGCGGAGGNDAEARARNRGRPDVLLHRQGAYVLAPKTMDNEERLPSVGVPACLISGPDEPTG